MKRNLFAAFLAVALVVALVLVVAPNAKAEDKIADYTVNANNEVVDASGKVVTEISEAGKVLDMQGRDATVKVTASLTVVDTYFMESKDMSGEGAGKLTLAEGSTGEINAWGQFNDLKYLKVENEGGTYSFHPFNMSITQYGVHVKGNAVSLEVRFVANEIVKQKLTGYGLSKLDGESKPTNEYTNLMDTEKYGETYMFEEGKYSLRVCFDLKDSLTEENVGKTRHFAAYVEIDGTPITGSQQVAVTPSDILETVNTQYAGGNIDSASKTLAKVLYFNNPHLRGKLTAIEDAIKTVATYEKITSIEDLTSGNYVIVNKSNGRALGTVGTYGEGGNAPTAVAVQPTFENGILTDTKGAVCEIVVAGARVTLKPVPGEANLIAPMNGTYAQDTGLVSRTTAFMWNVVDNEDDTFSFVFTSQADKQNYQLAAVGNIFMNRNSTTAVESANPYFELYKEVTSEVLNCTGHIDKNGAEGGNICDFCNQTFVPIPAPKYYDYDNNFETLVLDTSSSAGTVALDDIVSINSYGSKVSANQKTIITYTPANGYKTSYLTIESKFNISQIVMEIGQRNKGDAVVNNAFNYAISFLNADGEQIGETISPEEDFTGIEELTLNEIPAGCRAIKIHSITGVNTWLGLYNFELTFTD